MEKKYSFKEFLTVETYIGVDSETEEEIMGVISKIEIPMIQRDYAQGRIKEFKGKEPIINDTGSRFLRSIFKSIKDNEEMELEFIYGSVEERPIPKSKDKEYAYIPLDGQQRLTTLFLLYWYFGMREISVGSDALKDHLALLSKFTYLTRTSSRIFCECICSWEKMGNVRFGDKKPSLIIENCPWYYKEYKKDPTVKAMLTILDYIDMLYKTENTTGDDYLPRLEKLKFYAFPLNKYKLTEDLYIKMNARGKQLSGYENFKADLINWMKSNNNPEVTKFNRVVTYKGRNMKYYMAFAQKLDNEWTDLFWNTLKKDSKPEALDDKTVDGSFMRFFIRYFFNERILYLLQNSDLTDEAITNDEIVKYFYGDKGDDIVVTYNNNDFEDKYQVCLSYDTIQNIETFLDGIVGKLDLINRVFVPSWQKDNPNKEDSFYGLRISWPARIVFLATTNYFKSKWNFDETHFCDWIRIVWNFAVDPTIRNIKDNIGALRFIDDLSKNSADIISWLATHPEGSRMKSQYSEEHVKAQLILKNPEWRSHIVNGEKHRLLKGRILFLLPDKENTEIEKYNKYLKISEIIIPSNKWDFLWIRAILSQLDEYNITAGPLTLSNERENWKTSISDNLMLPMQSLLEKLSSYVDADNTHLCNTALTQYMRTLCETYQPKNGIEWVYPLVKWQQDGQTLLLNYTFSQKIEAKDGNVYLCYKNHPQADSSILLSGLRDSIISKILPNTDKEFEWSYTSYKCNIHDTFFRGMKVTLFRTVELETLGTIKCAYVFDASKIVVGIRSIDNPFMASQEAQAIWACSKIYSIPTIIDDIEPLVNKIENEVFNLDNEDSLLSRASKSDWVNEVIEEIGEAGSSSRGLRITFDDGKTISNKLAVLAFIEALQKIKLERIPPLGITHSGYNLVSKEKRPDGNWQREVDGWYIYINISNSAKCDDLRKISNELHLNLIVEDGID